MTFIKIILTIIFIFPVCVKAEITLWHSYRGQELKAMDKIIAEYNSTQNDSEKIKALNIPYEVLASKLNTAVPQGNGPDIFIFAHERVGDFVLAKIAEPLDQYFEKELQNRFFEKTLNAAKFDNKLYGLPLAFKYLTLFYNKKFFYVSC